MKSLGELIRRHIKESGYTIYKIAHSAGINRTTLQKILSDDRPASEELLHKLLPILNLSPDESREVWKLFEISQTGEAVYRQRQCILELIEATASLDCLFYSETFDGKFTPPPPPDRPKTLGFPPVCSHTHRTDHASSSVHGCGANPIISRLVSGVHNVERLIGHFLTLGCKETDYAPTILVSAPGNLSVLEELFVHQLPNCRSSSKLELIHITPLIKASHQSGLMYNNIEILSHILPITISQAFQYQAYCFYRKELLLDSPQYAFPYYIVFSTGVILLSCDGHTALPLMDKNSLFYFRNLFFASQKKAAPLITTCTRPEEILQRMVNINNELHSLCTLEYQPCFTASLTEAMVKKYLNPDIMNKNCLVHYICLMIEQLASTERHACIFSKDGITDLAFEGLLSDVPSKYFLPISIPDRIQLLKGLYLACKEDRQFLRMINPVTLALPKHLGFNIWKEHSVDFCGCPSCGTTYNYVHITEPGIVESFEDFYSYLSKSSLIYTKEETLKEIEAMIASLSVYGS